MKKAQGISMTTIVVAAICLIVLVVIIVIFTGNINTWGGDIKSCTAKGGKSCGGACNAETQVEVPNVCPSGQHCCIDVRD